MIVRYECMHRIVLLVSFWSEIAVGFFEFSCEFLAFACIDFWDWNSSKSVSARHTNSQSMRFYVQWTWNVQIGPYYNRNVPTSALFYWALQSIICIYASDLIGFNFSHMCSLERQTSKWSEMKEEKNNIYAYGIIKPKTQTHMFLVAF